MRRLVEAFASEPDFVDLLPLALVLRDLAVVLALLPVVGLAARTNQLAQALQVPVDDAFEV